MTKVIEGLNRALAFMEEVSPEELKAMVDQYLLENPDSYKQYAILERLILNK